MKHGFFAAILRLLGIIMIAAVIVTALPASLPRLLGYQIYNVVSGSMEPSISVGSAIYVSGADPAAITVGEVAAFYVDGEVIAHRVVTNDTEQSCLYTKGDANEAADMNPVDYSDVIGTVAYVIPRLGDLMVLYASTQGKISVLGLLAAGVLLCLLARAMDSRRRRTALCVELDSGHLTLEQDGTKQAADDRGQVDHGLERRYRGLMLMIVLLALAFLVVLGVLAVIFYGYYTENQTYESARDAYVVERQESAQDGETQPDEAEGCPITVDFDELQASYPDIIAWIYCEDTVINYPVCYSGDDEYYLTHAYDGSASKSGAIFMEEANEAWTDANYILYGHHMKNKTMFATLSYWAEQAYYEAHPVMWLLTPQQNYRVDLFAGYTTSSTSDTYAIYRGNGEQLDAYLTSVLAQSDFTSEVAVSGDEGTYIVLSTCEYSFENARYVLHGRLIPID